MRMRGFSFGTAIPVIAWAVAAPASAQVAVPVTPNAPAPSNPASVLTPSSTPDASTGGDPASRTDPTEIIVTAQRRAEVLERTPVAVSAVSGQVLQQRAIVSESDLQSAVPGLTVKQGQTSNQLNYSLRGQTVDTFSSSRPSVLPYVDEVQVGASGSSAFYDLESVQVLKGPQGTLFGRNSTGGAVVFTTVKPKDEFGGYAVGRGGNYGQYQFEGALNVPIIDDKLLLRIAGFAQHRNGIQENIADGRKFGIIGRQDGRVSFTFKPTSTFKNDLVVDYGHTGGNNVEAIGYNIRTPSEGSAFVPSNSFYEPSVDAILGPGTYAAFLAAHPEANPAGLAAEVAAQNARGPYKTNVDGPNFYRSKNIFISNISTLSLADDMDLKNIVGYVGQHDRHSAEYDGTIFPIDDTGQFGIHQKLSQFSEELQLQGKTLNRDLQYTAGFFYSKERDHTRSTTFIFDFSPFIPRSEQINDGVTRNRTLAGYAQGTYSLANLTGIQGLGITAGVRYSSEKITFDREADDFFITNPNPNFRTPQKDTFNKVSWQFGVQEQANNNLLLYAVTRRSNRSGGFNFYAPPVPGFGNDGGGEYKPEIATDVELGAKYRGKIGVPVRFNLALYQMWIDNVQRADYVEVFGSLAGITVNVPKARVRGIETDASIQPASWLTIGGDLNYTDAKFTNDLVSVLGNPAVAFSTYPDTPKWSGQAYVDLTAHLSPELKLTLHASGYAQTSTYYVSNAKTVNFGAHLPGYATADFRVGVEQEKQGWSLSAILKNAFDRTYYVGGVGFSSLLGVNTAIPADPRTVLVEARLKF